MRMILDLNPCINARIHALDCQGEKENSMKIRRLYPRQWYGTYPLNAYAFGPIRANSKREAQQAFKLMFGQKPKEVWKA